MLTLSPEVLTNAVVNKDFSNSPSGAHCRFVKLDNNWGIKVYPCRKDVRDRAYEMQTKMAAVGLAPQTGVSFDIETNYCYVTEVARPIIEGAVNDESDEYLSEFEYLNELYEEKMYKCQQKMMEHGFCMEDVHIANFGRLGNKFVCIDFGE